MNVRTFTLTLGGAYVVAGILGFIPGITTEPPAHAPSLLVDAAYGYFLGLFPVNALHNMMNILIGALGMIASRTTDGARAFNRGIAVVFGVLAVMGLFPVLNTTFRLMPLFGHDIWLHALCSALTAYFGYSRLPMPARRPSPIGGNL